jgi:replicative DNA helicase
LNKEQLEDKVKKLGQLPMYWFDSRNFEDAFTIAKFKDLVRQTRDRYGIKFVVLDDLDFLVSSSQKYQNENEVVSTLMTELKTLANTLNIHIIVITHIVKSAGEGIPRMRDIKGSGAIMQRADYVMLIHRETAADADENLKADVTVVLEKNRPGGETGLIHYRYDKVTRRYRED